MKTKIFALLLAGVMGFSLASCGGTAKAPDSSDFAQTSGPRFRLKQKKKLRKRPGISTSSLPAMFTAA